MNLFDDDDPRMDFFPTVQEIVEHVPLTRCDECGRTFQNSSACRFHQLKQHLSLDVTSSNERRLFKKGEVKQRVVMAYHCPDPLCSSKKAWFDGIRNLKQHYFRAHTEKKFGCDMCGFKTALEKDLNYHIKARCPERPEIIEKKNALKAAKEAEKEKKARKRKKASTAVPKRKRKSKRRESSSEEDDNSTESPQPSTSSAAEIKPIFLIVNQDNIHQVVDTIRKALNPADISLHDIDRIPDPHFVPRTEKNDALIPTSSSFATQYEPVETTSFCERGTMMNETPLDYFDPPFGAEFGDMAPSADKPFDYQGPSTSQQTQTRSFGTMFENVTTCNTGTSMIDESYMSEFLRDIETQTPTYMTPSEEPSEEWPPWRMTDGDI